MNMSKYHACKTGAPHEEDLLRPAKRSKGIIVKREGKETIPGPEHAPRLAAPLIYQNLSWRQIGWEPGGKNTKGRHRPLRCRHRHLSHLHPSIPSHPLLLSHSAGRVPGSIVAILLGISHRRQCHARRSCRIFQTALLAYSSARLPSLISHRSIDPSTSTSSSLPLILQQLLATRASTACPPALSPSAAPLIHVSRPKSHFHRGH